MNNKPLRVVRIVEGTSVDGPGLRTSIYFAGCAHRCPGCHNEHTWDFMSGKDMSIGEILETIRYNGFNVTFSGGDPLYQAEAILPLAIAIKEMGYTIWCYTGFTFEELLGNPVEGALRLLPSIDVLVDGLFERDRKDTELIFRGSANQRIIDVPESLRTGHTVLIKDESLLG